MGKVITALAMSLDGFVAGPNDGPQRPLGDGGERLFRWYFSGDTEVHMQGGPVLKVSKESAQVLQNLFRTLGAKGCWSENVRHRQCLGREAPRRALFYCDSPPAAGMGQARLTVHFRHRRR